MMNLKNITSLHCMPLQTSLLESSHCLTLYAFIHITIYKDESHNMSLNGLVVQIQLLNVTLTTEGTRPTTLTLSRGWIIKVAPCPNFHLLGSRQLFHNIEPLGRIGRRDLDTINKRMFSQNKEGTNKLQVKNSLSVIKKIKRRI